MWRQNVRSDDQFLTRTNPSGWWERLRGWYKKPLPCQWVEPLRPGSPRFRYCELPAVSNNLCQIHLKAWDTEREYYSKYPKFEKNPLNDDEHQELTQLEPWQLTQEEFIDVLNFRSGKEWHQPRDPKTIEDFNFINIKNKPELLESTLVQTPHGPRHIEYRQSGKKNRYVKTGADGSPVRDPSIPWPHNLIFYTDEEVIDKGWALHEIGIYAFDGDSCIGMITDEWGATLLEVALEYNRCGIGRTLYLLMHEQCPYRCSGGFTPMGYQFIKKLHKNLVLEAVDRGFPVEDRVLKSIMN